MRLIYSRCSLNPLFLSVSLSFQFYSLILSRQRLSRSLKQIDYGNIRSSKMSISRILDWIKSYCFVYCKQKKRINKKNLYINHYYFFAIFCHRKVFPRRKKERKKTIFPFRFFFFVWVFGAITSRETMSNMNADDNIKFNSFYFSIRSMYGFMLLAYMCQSRIHHQFI